MLSVIGQNLTFSSFLVTYFGSRPIVSSALTTSVSSYFRDFIARGRSRVGHLGGGEGGRSTPLTKGEGSKYNFYTDLYFYDHPNTLDLPPLFPMVIAAMASYQLFLYCLKFST